MNIARKYVCGSDGKGLFQSMDMMGWFLFITAAIAVVVLMIRNGDAKKQLERAEARLAGLTAEESTGAKQPVAAVVGGGHVSVSHADALGDTQKRLNASIAEIKRLESALRDAETRVRAEAQKAEEALAKASVAEAKVSQTRSRATEAGHAALLEAKKETESVRERLADAEKRLLSVSDPDKRMGELVGAAKRAEAEAVAGAERVKHLQNEIETLRERLAQADALASANSLAVAAAREEAERSSRAAFEAKLMDARNEFEEDLQSRLAAERERFEAEQRRLSLELAMVHVGPSQREQKAEAVVFPSSESKAPRRAPSRSAVPAESEHQTKPLVILADADPEAARTTALHLEAGGYAVRHVRSVADTLQAARDTAPVAIALDGSNLPDGDCWRALASVKEDPDLKEIPVLVFAPTKDKERAIEMGAASCFPKPVDKAVLVASINAAMVKRKQRARLAAVSGSVGIARRPSLLTTPSQ